MKANEIKKSALAQFVDKGYEATTLDDIVKEIGIKKQSVYSHFKHKEDIFLQVMQDTLNKEISFLKQFFLDHLHYELKDTLFQLLIKYKDRYIKQGDVEFKFLLRMAFMPPFHLQSTVMGQFQLYNQELEQMIKQVFLNNLNNENIKVTAEEGMISFLNFLDGILVELIYSSSSIQKFETRLKISWAIYWKGVTS